MRFCFLLHYVLVSFSVINKGNFYFQQLAFHTPQTWWCFSNISTLSNGWRFTFLSSLCIQIKLTTICPYIVDTGLCKNPKIKFPSLMKILSPQEAADNIVDAVRRNYHEITIPSSLYYINQVRREQNNGSKFNRWISKLGFAILFNKLPNPPTTVPLNYRGILVKRWS